MIPNIKNENDSKQLRQLLHDFEFSMSIYELYENFLSNFLSKNQNVQYVKYAFNKHTMHEKWSFLLRICSVSVTKSGNSCQFGHISEEVLNKNLHFLCSGNLQGVSAPVSYSIHPYFDNLLFRENILFPFFPRLIENKNWAVLETDT